MFSIIKFTKRDKALQELHQSMVALQTSLPQLTANDYAGLLSQYESTRMIRQMQFEQELKEELKKFNPNYRELLKQQDALAGLALVWAKQMLVQAEQVKLTKSIIPSLVPGRRDKLKENIKKLSKLVD